jgi:hypothetical protein
MSRWFAGIRWNHTINRASIYIYIYIYIFCVDGWVFFLFREVARLNLSWFLAIPLRRLRINTGEIIFQLIKVKEINSRGIKLTENYTISLQQRTCVVNHVAFCKWHMIIIQFMIQILQSLCHKLIARPFFYPAKSPPHDNAKSRRAGDYKIHPLVLTYYTDQLLYT